jgi:DNA-binding NarL/FixJ family response regulator
VSTSGETRSDDQPKTRVLIVDEHRVLSDGLERALRQSGADVLGIATTANAALGALSMGLADAVIFCMRTQKPQNGSAANGDGQRDEPARLQATPVFASGLTARERQVLRLLVAGASNKDVARRLSIRSNTVRTHVQNLLAKLRVHTRLEAVTLAIRAGLIEPDGDLPIVEVAKP